MPRNVLSVVRSAAGSVRPSITASATFQIAVRRRLASGTLEAVARTRIAPRTSAAHRRRSIGPRSVSNRSLSNGAPVTENANATLPGSNRNTWPSG